MRIWVLGLLFWGLLLQGAEDQCPRTLRKVKPCAAIETNIYYVEEYLPELEWTVEKFPRGMTLRSNIGLSYEFADIPKYFADPWIAMHAITVRQAWLARMTISPTGQISVVRSPLDGILGEEKKKHLKATFARYLKREIVTPGEVAEFEAEEAGLDPMRVTYFTFTDIATKEGVSVGDTDTAIRLYDGSPYPGLVRQSLKLKVAPKGDTHLVPPEHKHPAVFKHLRKELGENTILFDLGRLGVSEELDYGLPAILREIALTYGLYRFRYDFTVLPNAHFVMSATAAGARLYAYRYGMHLLDPEELKKAGAIDEEQYEALKGSPYRYLHMPVKEFMEKFINGPRVY